MGDHSEQLPPPESPEAFENLCLDLFRELWADPAAQKNGRSGQKQAGVDVYGCHHGHWIGVQCKQKSGLLRTRVTVRELQTEVALAFVGKPPKKPPFKPPLSRFILATTGPRDADVQERARLYREAGIEVEVWGWEDIWHELYQRPDLLDRIKSVYWPRLSGLGEQKLATSRLPRGAPELFGREVELARLEEAWRDKNFRIVTIVAWGGVGKTALVGKWVADLGSRNFDGADYFDWSFYSQGTRDHSTASADAFVDAALRFFGDSAMADSSRGAWDKGARLAELVGRRRTLLVLDGLEPLQHPPGPLAGELKDPAIKALLRGLAMKNLGLCVVTTRESIVELASHWHGGAPEWLLDRLSIAAGVHLFQTLGVDGTRLELEAAVEEVDGHALTLSLFGRFLARAHGGDIRKRDRVEFHKADQKTGRGHAFRAIEAYEKWFACGDADNQRQLAILRLLGLFDRPAADAHLAALRAEPPIEGLTDDLVGLGEDDWNLLVSDLAEAHLLAREPGTVDAHPLIREYFGYQLCERQTEAWRGAHGRLFDHLKESTEHQPATLVGLQPLYQAVYHGCKAGRQQEACDEVYRDRISRGKEAFVVHKLGAFGADLAAVTCFFETQWSRVDPTLSEVAQAWLLGVAAFHLLALGRIREAIEPMRAGVPIDLAGEDWENAARRANNLSGLELTLGDVRAAVSEAERAVAFADRNGNAFLQMVGRTTLADTWHQAGEVGLAEELFREAERIQAEFQPQFPLLYTVWGFRYCDLLLAPAEQEAGRELRVLFLEREEACAEVKRRAKQTLEWVSGLVGAAFEHLCLGRAWLYQTIGDFDVEATVAARTEIEKAVTGLRVGMLPYLPLGLLTRAWLRQVDGDPEGARADLDEAQEIAERGSMKLHLADVALYRARLFGDRAALAEAKRLVEECGYGRRRAEVAELEARLKSAGA